MNKMILWTVFFLGAGLFADPLETFNEQVENKQKTVPAQAEPLNPVSVKEVSKTKALSIEASVTTPDLKEKVAAVEEPIHQFQVEKEALVVEVLKETEPDLLTKKVNQPVSGNRSTSTKKEEKAVSFRFANIAISVASVAVVIVASVLGTN